MNETMIAYCGLTCTECPAYLATKNNDEKLARETAELWSRQFNVEVALADVWCDGCLVDGKKCAHCGECEIRACAQKRKVVNCAHCPDYGCDMLAKFFQMVPPAEQTLSQIRSSL